MGWAKNPGCIERGKCKQGSSHRAGRQSKERDFFKGEKVGEYGARNTWGYRSGWRFGPSRGIGLVGMKTEEACTCSTQSL